jgi:chorismate synthase
MSGNSFGLLYCVTSFGESHGPAYGGVVDGCPPGLELAEADIQKELDRRKPGKSRHVTQRQESDRIEIPPGFSRAAPPAPRSAFSSATRTSARKTTLRSPTRFARDTPTIRIGEIRAARLPRRRARVGTRTAIRVAAGAIAKKWLRERLGRGARVSRAGRADPIAFKSWDAVDRIRSSRPTWP